MGVVYWEFIPSEGCLLDKGSGSYDGTNYQEHALLSNESSGYGSATGDGSGCKTGGTFGSPLGEGFGYGVSSDTSGDVHDSGRS